MLAGIARGQLEVLPLRVQQRRTVFERYCQAFADIPGIEPQPEVRYDGAKVGQCDGISDPATAEPPHRPTGLPSHRLTVSPPHHPFTPVHTRWLSCFLIDEQKFGMSQMDLIKYLDAANIESRPVWKPMHTQKLYQGYDCVGGAVAKNLNTRGVCLPSSSSLTEEEQRFVIDRVREAHHFSAARKNVFFPSEKE